MNKTGVEHNQAYHKNVSSLLDNSQYAISTYKINLEKL